MRYRADIANMADITVDGRYWWHWH